MFFATKTAKTSVFIYKNRVCIQTMPKSYGHTGTILGSKKSRSKSRPRTDVAAYLRQKTEKEQKVKDDKAREKERKDREAKKRREERRREREDADRLARYRKIKEEEDREERAARRAKAKRLARENEEKVKAAVSRRRRMKSRSVSPVRDRPDLRAVVGKTGGTKRGRTASEASVQYKPRKEQKRPSRLAGKKRGGKHGDVSKEDIERYTQGLSMTTAEALKAREASYVPLKERLRREPKEISAPKRQRSVSYTPSRLPARAPSPPARSPPAASPPRKPSPTPAFKEFQKMTETPLAKPRYTRGLAEKEQVTTEAIEKEKAERMAKYGGGDISGMSKHPASVAPAPTVSKAPKKRLHKPRGSKLDPDRLPEAGGAVGGVNDPGRTTGSGQRGAELKVKRRKVGQAVGGTVDPRQGRDLSEATIARRFNLKPGTTTPSPAPEPLEKPLLRPKGAKKPKVSRAVTFAQELGDRPRTGGFAATVSPSRLDAARQAVATQQVTGLGGQLAEVSADPSIERTRRMLEMRRNLPAPSPGFEQPTALQLSGGGKDPLGDDDDTDEDKPEKDDPETPKDDPRSPYPRGPIKIPDPEPEETPAAPVVRMRSLTREPELSPSPEPAMAQRATREEATRLRSPEAVAPTPAPEETMPEETPAQEPTVAPPADPVGLPPGQKAPPADPKLATESPAEQEDVFDPDEDAILGLQQKVAEQRRQIERARPHKPISGGTSQDKLLSLRKKEQKHVAHNEQITQPQSKK